MRPRLISLALLLALSLRLGAGPHPCHAMQSAAKPGSCHGAHPASKAPLPGEGDCCKGGHALCEYACQTAAVLQVILPPPTHLPYGEQTSVPEELSLPLFVLAIDHVPLA
jgi:hypothetical protein